MHGDGYVLFESVAMLHYTIRHFALKDHLSGSFSFYGWTHAAGTNLPNGRDLPEGYHAVHQSTCIFIYSTALLSSCFPGTSPLFLTSIHFYASHYFTFEPGHFSCRLSPHQGNLFHVLGPIATRSISILNLTPSLTCSGIF